MENQGENNRLTFETKMNLCSAVLDTGFVGNTEEYLQERHRCSIDELTEQKAKEVIDECEKNKGAFAVRDGSDGLSNVPLVVDVREGML